MIGLFLVLRTRGIGRPIGKIPLGLMMSGAVMCLIGLLIASLLGNPDIRPMALTDPMEVFRFWNIGSALAGLGQAFFLIGLVVFLRKSVSGRPATIG